MSSILCTHYSDFVADFLQSHSDSVAENEAVDGQGPLGLSQIVGSHGDSLIRWRFLAQNQGVSKSCGACWADLGLFSPVLWEGCVHGKSNSRP